MCYLSVVLVYYCHRAEAQLQFNKYIYFHYLFQFLNYLFPLSPLLILTSFFRDIVFWLAVHWRLWNCLSYDRGNSTCLWQDVSRLQGHMVTGSNTAECCSSLLLWVFILEPGQLSLAARLFWATEGSRFDSWQGQSIFVFSIRSRPPVEPADLPGNIFVWFSPVGRMAGTWNWRLISFWNGGALPSIFRTP
jgi:hypothetical protein